jgi:LPS-assembly protein
MGMARRWVKICWVLPILLWAGLAGAAEMDLFKAERFQGGPWRIKAETLTYDAANHVYVARGRVEISQADRRITADQAEVDDVTKVATLTGNVVMVMEEDVFTGTKGRFNLATRNGELEDARLFLQRNHFRVTGKVIRRTGDNTYTAEEATVTTCDADRPVWSFSARKLAVTVEGYGIGRDAAFNLGGVPVLRLPFAVLPVMNERQSGFLMPFFGQHKAGGTVVELPFYWAISNNSDATLYQTLLSNRGYMQGAEFRHQGHDDSAVNVRFFYLDDGKPNEPTDHRYWVAGMVNQPLPDDWKLRTTVDRASDFNYLSDFNFGYMGLNRYSRDLLDTFGRNLEEQEVSTRVSTFQLSRNFSWANFTAYGSYYDRLNPSDPMVWHRLPGISLTSLPLPVAKLPLVPDLPLYFGMNGSYDYFLQHQGLNGDRLDLHPQFTLQGQPLPAVAFNSEAGFRETVFRVDQSVPDSPGDGFLNRQIFDSRVGLSSAWDRDYGRDDGASTYFRHIIRPELTYWNIGNYNPQRYPDFDLNDVGWTTRANRNLPIREGDDPLGRVNALTYGISNSILWRSLNKEGQANVKDLVWFRLSQSSFFNKDSLGLDGTPQPHHPFSDFLAESEVYPSRQVTLGLDMAASPYNEGFEQANAKLTLLDANRQNFLNVNYVFLKDFAKQVNVQTYLNLMQSVKTWLTYGHTFQTNKQLENNYGIIFQRQCWGVALSFTDRPDDKRVSAVVFIPGLGEKMNHSPVHFSGTKSKEEAPDFF